MSAFVFYAVLAAGAVGAISEVTGELLRAAGAAERLFELLAARPVIAAPQTATPLPDPPRGEISVEAVSFNYPSRPDQPVLEDVTFKVSAGERVALVGPSGAGKSTLLTLILRFYDPQSGTLKFDGVDLRQVDPARAAPTHCPGGPGAGAVHRQRLGQHPLRPSRVPTTTRYAPRPKPPIAPEFLNRLPEGFSTSLGPGGVQLSGGQRQRIAIARAILRDPALLLLDEATSSLDAESERRVQEALEHLMVDRTSIVIAHRLATVVAADRIVVLEQGRVHAVGSHRELLESSELYARLAALQFGSPERKAG